ncbi:MAG: efflux RND transporter periplasmic adaptor subunit [Bryobacteraceae bacterium]|jgi:cobalt-zinc-cadmium efflux system membrane fusion protein
MRRKGPEIVLLFVFIPLVLAVTSCGNVHAQDPSAGLPPAPKVVPFPDAALFTVDHPEQFPLAAATEHPATSELVVTGTVTPDVSRQVPVPSLATGRIVEIDARLGDQVTKGQLLFKVRSTDIAGAYSTYLQAVKNELLAVDNERLTTIQLNRAKILFENGSIPKSALEIAENAEVGMQTALENARVITVTAKEQLGLLGVDPDHPGGIVSVYAPVAGTITDQEITNQSAVQSYATPTPFTISDLSSVWVVCDVYENDLATVQIGDTADITLNAYPDRKFKGKVSNILPNLDPSIRTAKVRIEVQNPGIMRVAMFVTATFHGQTTEMHTIVPASAVMHMHDRDFVFEPAPGNKFRQVEVVSGDLLKEDTNLQEVKSGLTPGQQVVTNALVLDHVLGQ